MSRHILVVESDTEYNERFPDFPPEVKWRIECPDGNDCDAFTECMDSHKIDGRNAADGPWDGDEDAPWSEEEEFEFHGVLHTWQGDYGWTVPFKGCGVATVCDEPPDGMELTIGRHEVIAEWEDEWVYLHLPAAEEDTNG